MPTTLLIAEDDYLVREGARAVLDSVDGYAVLGTAGDPENLLALVDAHDPDAVVVDIRMPPTFTTEGIELARRLRDERPGIGIVVLSQHADPEYALELLGEGSNGLAYLLKERLGDAEQLVMAIEEVVDGGSVVDPKIVEALMEAQRRRTASRLLGLSGREIEVLRLMASGQGNAAIARSLSIADKTVEKNISSIFRKLGLSEEVDINRRVSAVLFFLQRSRS